MNCTASHFPASHPTTLPLSCLLPASGLLTGTPGALGPPGGVAALVEHGGAAIAHHHTTIKGEDDLADITDLTDVTLALADLQGSEVMGHKIVKMMRTKNKKEKKRK